MLTVMYVNYVVFSVNIFLIAHYFLYKFAAL